MQITSAPYTALIRVNIGSLEASVQLENPPSSIIYLRIQNFCDTFTAVLSAETIKFRTKQIYYLEQKIIILKR